MPRSTRNVWSADGIRLSVTDHRGSGAGPDVYLAHATGFCGSVWDAVIAEVPGAVRSVTTWDFRGHGSSGRGSAPVSWWDMAGDAGAVRDSGSARQAIGAGHSMGGAALVMAQILDPSRFQALVLVEPIVPPPPYRREAHQLADLARKRRRTFPDRARAWENFASKPPFDHWAPTALEGYVDCGFRRASDGSMDLACSPEFEAEVFTAAGASGLFERIHEVDIPVTLLFGEAWDTFPREWAEAIASRFPDARLEVVAGGDHFLPMAVPAVVAAAIGRYLG